MKYTAATEETQPNNPWVLVSSHAADKASSKMVRRRTIRLIFGGKNESTLGGVSTKQRSKTMHRPCEFLDIHIRFWAMSDVSWQSIQTPHTAARAKTIPRTQVSGTIGKVPNCSSPYNHHTQTQQNRNGRGSLYMIGLIFKECS